MNINRSFNKLYPRVGARIVTPFLLAIAVIASIAVFTITRLMSSTVQERFNNQLVDSAVAASNAIVDVEVKQLATLRLMVFTQGVADAIGSRFAEKLIDLLRPVAANTNIDHLVVYDAEGRGLVNLKRTTDAAGTAYATLPALNVTEWHGAMRTISGELDLRGDKFVDLIDMDDGAYIFWSAPVVLENSDTNLDVIGGISAAIKVSTMVQGVGAQALSSVALYDQQGRVIGSTFRNVREQLLMLTADELAEFSQTLNNTTSSPLIERSLENVPYQLLYSRFRLRGEPVGLLGVGLPSNFIVERSSTSRDLASLLFSVLFAVVLLLGIVIARTITRPVARLVDTTRAIHAGDLSRRVQLQIPDELGELGTSFDRMTDQLVDQNQRIQRLYDEQLQETIQRDAVLTSINDAVIVQGFSGETILKNKAADRLFERASLNRLLKSRLDMLLSAPDLLVTEPQVLEFDDSFFSVLATPMRMPNGALRGHVIVCRDFSEIGRAERLKDDLILQMSHELRTPLTALKGGLDVVRLLDQKKLSEKGGRYLDVATEHTSTLERMVNQVVDVSSIIAGKFRLDRDRFDLVEIAHRQHVAWWPRMEKRELRFKAALPGQSLYVIGDALRTGQVIDHLLRNAYSYTLTGGIVTLAATQRNGCAAVTISDNGVGIKPDELSKVFDRMYRGSAASAGPTDSRGLGLGLYLSKTIIEAQGGSIRLTSEPGKGTSVTIELPIEDKYGNNGRGT